MVSGDAGCSPDGMAEDRGVEIKCPNDKNYFAIIIDGEKAIDKKYLWQCQFSMMVTGLDKWDLVFYNRNFDRNILIFEQTRDEEMIKKLEEGVKKGKVLLTNLKEKYERS
jgi:hypothetical protein